MKKYSLLFIFLLISLNLFCQTNSGTVTYSILPIAFEVKNPESRNKKLIEEMKMKAQQQTFTLEFNSKKSRFILVDKLDNSNGSSEKEEIINKLAFLRFTVDYDFYLDREAGYQIYKKRDNTLIKKNSTPYNWEISTESKKIGDYLCYKAVYQKTYVNRLGKTITRPITAWFAPSLPFSYGPQEYYGLPGLILELQENETIYLATSIIPSEKEIVINFPKGKTITEEDFNAEAIEGMKKVNSSKEKK